MLLLPGRISTEWSGDMEIKFTKAKMAGHLFGERTTNLDELGDEP